MAGFDRIDVASALREIMRDVSKQTVEVVAPRPNYGRVISVNTSALTATVWFPGDDEPISVGLFPNTVPGAWQERAGSGIENTSYVGYGSQVAVQDINGKPYITQVITGGVISADANALGSSLVTQEATEIAADLEGLPTSIVGVPHESFINCHVSNASVGDGGAIQFGPFTATGSQLPGIGWTEVSIVEKSGSAKFYRFPNNPLRDFERTGGTDSLDSWFRLVPEQQISDNGGTVVDFDFEIAIKRTPYGDVDRFFQEAELWMRVIKRGTSWTGLDCKVTIRSTNIQRGRALSGRELFMQQTLTSPPEARGYVGFHNSQMIFRDFNDYGVLDNYGRTVDGSWGVSDSGPSWLVRTGTATNWGVDGSAAYANLTTNGVVMYNTLQQTGVLNTDTYWDTWCSVMPTGAEVQTGHISRAPDLNNLYQFKVVFQTAGTLTLSVVKFVSGSGTVLGSDLNTGITFTANERIRCRARVVSAPGTSTNNALFMKVWKPATQREPDWMKIDLDNPGIGSNAANVVGFFAFPGAANSNTKPFKVYFDNVRTSLYTKGQDNSGAQWHTGPWRSGILRLAENLQKTWVNTGRFRWDGTNLYWTQRIYFGGVGQHRLGLAAGSTMLQCPPSGFTVPIVPNGGSASVVTAGIPLAAGQALWCAVPPGQTWENLYEYLFITSATATANFDMPEWAVLIAARSDTDTVGPQIRLGNGQHIDRWRTPTFNNSWASHGSVAPPMRYRFLDPNNVQMIGRLSPGTKVDGTSIMTLITGAAPDNNFAIPVTASPQVTTENPHFEVSSGGDVQCYGCSSAVIVAVNAIYPLDVPT